jgi:hypothetical protein
MNIKQLARDTIAALGIVPDKLVWVNQSQQDWNGTPQIVVTSEPFKPENETQFGAVTVMTVLTIRSFAKTEEAAEDLCRQAAGEVYTEFTKLEQTRGSGILCIMYHEHDLSPIPDRSDCWQAFVSFRITQQP